MTIESVIDIYEQVKDRAHAESWHLWNDEHRDRLVVLIMIFNLLAKDEVHINYTFCKGPDDRFANHYDRMRLKEVNGEYRLDRIAGDGVVVMPLKPRLEELLEALSHMQLEQNSGFKTLRQSYPKLPCFTRHADRRASSPWVQRNVYAPFKVVLCGSARVGILASTGLFGGHGFSLFHKESFETSMVALAEAVHTTLREIRMEREEGLATPGLGTIN